MRKSLSAAFVMAAIAVSPLSSALAHEGQDHPVVAGKVTKVDASAGKITIAHDAIPNLQMEAMTMVFKAADPAMLKEVKPGDAIKFMADRVNGELTVTEIETAR
jgi:Cu(I)/Ag(I) efflux system protein CusF